MDSFEIGGTHYDVEISRPDPYGFWVVAWDGRLCRGLSVEECVRAIAAAQDAARRRFPGRGGVVRVMSIGRTVDRVAC